jgi:hypothetical protein
MSPKKKKKRIGTITVGIRYVVDIDDSEMVKQAKDYFYDDLYKAIVKINSTAEFESLLDIKQDLKLKEKDIDQFLQDDAEERRRLEKEE